MTITQPDQGDAVSENENTIDPAGDVAADNDGDDFDAIIADLEKQVAELTQRAEAAEAALTAAQTAQGAPEAAAAVDDTPDSEGNAEAAKWRRKLRDTEQQRDAALERLASQHRAIVDDRLTAEGLDPRIWELSGHTIDGLLDQQGRVQRDKLDQAVADAASIADRRPRRPKPNPLVGNPGDPRPAVDPFKAAFGVGR